MSDVGVVGSVEPEVLARLLAETDHGQDVEARLTQAVADSAAAVAAAPTAAQADAISFGLAPSADNPFVTRTHWDALLDETGLKATIPAIAAVAARTPALPPLSVTGRGVDAQGVLSCADLHRVVLGHGQEFTLSMFGWAGGGDIYPALRAAVSAATSLGGSCTIQLPAGRLRCSNTIVIPSCWPYGILIRGKGRQVTTVEFTNNTNGFDFDGHSAQNMNFLIGGGIESLTVYGAAPPIYTGVGLRFTASIFCSIRDVWVFGWGGVGGIATHVRTGADGFVSQDMYMSNVHSQGSYTGMSIDGLNQFTAIQCCWNQNLHTGLKLTQADGIFVGSLMQGVSPYGIHIAPKQGQAAGVTFNNLSFEGIIENAIIQCESAGGGAVLELSGGIRASAGNGATLLSVDSCALNVSGDWGWYGVTKLIKARKMSRMTISGHWADPSYYDFDAVSAKAATWISPGAIAIGTGCPPPLFSGSVVYPGGVSDSAGDGPPAFAAPAGSTYRNRLGGVGQSFFVNETGAVSGWRAK